jgi:hypothetical protein
MNSGIDFAAILLESPLIQREGCIEEQGVYKEFKAIIDQGVPVSMTLKNPPY